eukprot:s2950_g3.t1
MGNIDEGNSGFGEINLEISEPSAPEVAPVVHDDPSGLVQNNMPGFESGDCMEVYPVPMDTSPMPTELEGSENHEIILLDETPVKGCFCHMIQPPDTQPEFDEEWHVCDFCKSQRCPMDDIPTDIDDVATEAAAAFMIQNSMDHCNEVDVEGGEPSPLPATKYRRLRKLIVEPVMVDSPGTSDVEETGDGCVDDAGLEAAEDTVADDTATAEPPAPESRCCIDSPKEGAEPSSKYPLETPPYLAELKKQVETLDPPVFSTQGESAGKRKGRKKQVEPAAEKPKGNSRGRAKAKAAPRSRSKPAQPRVRGANAKSKPSPKRATPKKKACSKAKAVPKSRAQATPQAKVAEVVDNGSKEVAEPKPPRKPRAPKAPAANEGERIPPPHVTHNHIYSSAYRKSLSVCPGDKTLAKSQGAKAVEHFKTHGTVNGLCGVFREKPRGGRSADADHD